ncbi:hypothetical protein [Haloferula sp. BvORR071]|uniref:hypothetical protein n=1 Tax=Haloferula sp. BvORR071 TaxID=1396141 RepID=UPI00055250DC|nr:hypothetical protein [Haloferula sp. BvORR071]
MPSTPEAPAIPQEQAPPPPRFRSREFTRHLAEVIALGSTPLILGAINWALCTWQGIDPIPPSGPLWFSLLCLLVVLSALAGAIGYLIIAIRVWHSSFLDPGERLAIWAAEYFFISGYAALIILR